jgi:hypothetical protein
LRTEEVDDFVPIGPKVDSAHLQSLEEMVKVAQANLKINPVGADHYQLGKKVTDYRFCVGNSTTKDLPIVVDERTYDIKVTAGMHCGATDAERAADNQPGDAGGGAHRLFSVGRDRTGENKTSEDNTREDNGGLVVTLRSAEGVTYYLGEVLRQEICLDGSGECRDFTPRLIMVRNGSRDDPPTPLFEAVKRSPNRRDLVAVRYMDQMFCLPGDQSDRSAQVLTILGQLVNLNKSAKDNPASNIVTLVGH